MRDRYKGSRPSVGQYRVHTRHNGVQELMSLNEAYMGIVNGEYDTAPERLWSVIEIGEASATPGVRNRTGAIALEAATRLTKDPEEKVELITIASDNWNHVLKATEWAGITNTDTLIAKYGLFTLPSLASIALTDGLPAESIQHDMYANLIGLASDSMIFYNRASAKGNIVSRGEALGLQAELAVLLLHTRFSLTTDGIDALALPSYYSEDKGLSAGKGNHQSSAWDVNIHQADEDGLSVPTKIQVKSSVHALEYRKKEYADDITVLCIDRELAPASLQGKLKASWLLTDLVKEYDLSGRDELLDRERIDLGVSTSHLDVTVDRMLDSIDEWSDFTASK